MPTALLLFFIYAAPRAARQAPVHAVAGAEALLQEIDRRGPDAMLRQVYQSDERWQQVLDGIDSGTREWLQVAEKLKRVAREPSEELTIAVSRALEREPANVLAILGGAFDADDVCSLNTLEESLGRDYAVALRSVERRQQALARVGDPALKQKRDDCLAFLDELKREVVRNRSTWFDK